MVYVKYRCIICGNSIEEIFDFSSQLDKYIPKLDMQVCEIHRIETSEARST